MLEEVGIGIVIFLVSIGWLWYSHMMLDTMFPKIKNEKKEEE